MNRIEDTFVYKLDAAQKRLVAAVRDDFRTLPITHDNYITLHFIHENPGISQAQLARLNSKDANSLVVQLDRLEEAGYVERRRGIRDRRVHELYATDSGREMLESAWPHLVRRQEECLALLGEDERALLLAFLERIAQSGSAGEA